MDNAAKERRDEIPKGGLRRSDLLGQEMAQRRQRAWEQLSAAWSFCDDTYDRLARLSQVLTPEMVKGLQEAALMADAAGRVKLAQSLRSWATHIAEALDVDLGMGSERTRAYGEIWLG